MSLIEHLDELRKRIIISIFALMAGMVGCFIFKGRVLDLLTRPLKDKELITLSPTESFMTVFKVAAYGGMIVASPIIIYQLWAFVAPGLKAKEKRVVLYATIFTTFLFLGGVVFGWMFVLPRGLDFLLNYESDVFNQQVQAAKYFSFVAMFLLGFGLVFELPAVLLTLARLGIVSHRTLARNRKYAVLVGAIVSAVLTPGQDFFSMIAMAIPFMILYEFSVQASRVFQKRKDEKPEEAEDEDEDEDGGPDDDDDTPGGGGEGGPVNEEAEATAETGAEGPAETGAEESVEKTGAAEAGTAGPGPGDGITDGPDHIVNDPDEPLQ